MASEDWERHKANILHLYLLEKYHLNQVVHYMQQKHNFTKKKGQYEYQFKKWGVKKNLKKEHWQNLRHQLQKRAGKQSEVTFFGAPLSPSRVHKETQRYTAIPTAKEFGKQLPSPELLHGTMIRVQTPPIIEDITWPSLPWFRFKNRILPTSSEESYFQHRSRSLFKSLFDVSRNPLELRKAAFHLTNMIPDDSIGEHLKAESLMRKELPLSIATEMLKLIFFNLSNNNGIPNNAEERREAVYGSVI
ncbi:hypothetical protein F4859DRAFT_503583 [Xylaria cf. heliscus]|nr:hypothetical protein F4859DRAFT_503583 [Xylaria cf. heliscus]